MIIYNTTNYADISAGGVLFASLTHMTRAEVTEELNGIYEIEVDVLSTDSGVEYAKPGNILRTKVSPDASVGEQYFRIYEVIKPMTQVVTIKAQHITYDLAKVPVSPFEATGVANIISAINSHMMVQSLCNIANDGLTNTTSKMSITHPVSARQCLGGVEGSLLDLFHCEYRYDGLTAYAMPERGSDKGEVIRYGKNLTDIGDTTNNSAQATAVLGYAIVDEVVYVGNIYTVTASDYPTVAIVDFSDKYASDNLPTVALLTTDAQAYATSNQVNSIARSLSASYIDISLTAESNAQTIKPELGDTVTIIHKPLGISFKARIKKMVFDVLVGRYSSIEIGELKTSLNSLFEASTSGGTAKETPYQVTPTLLEASGVTVSRLNVVRSGNIVCVTMQVVLTATLNSYTKVAEGMPIPYGDNVLATTGSTSATLIRNMIVSTRQDSGIYLRYGAAGTYSLTYSYITAS